jgi:hypothetical protein
MMGMPHRGRVLPQRRGHVEPVDIGHHHVEGHQVGTQRAGHPDPLVTVDRLVDDVAVTFELLAEQLADRLVVVDDEDVRRAVGPAGAKVQAEVAQQRAGVEHRGGRLGRDREGQGDGERERRAAADLAVDVDVPAVVLDDLLADRQAEAGALRLAGEGVADLLEPDEQVGAIRRCHARDPCRSRTRRRPLRGASWRRSRPQRR